MTTTTNIDFPNLSFWDIAAIMPLVIGMTNERMNPALRTAVFGLGIAAFFVGQTKSQTLVQRVDTLEKQMALIGSVTNVPADLQL